MPYIVSWEMHNVFLFDNNKMIRKIKLFLQAGAECYDQLTDSVKTDDVQDKKKKRAAILHFSKIDYK